MGAEGRKMAFKNEQVTRITAFLRKIGVRVHADDVPDHTFLPGILVKGDTLIVDEAKLRYPGDLLHEAGHLAVAPGPERRSLDNDVSKDAGDEMATLAWSWAALTHLGLAPEVVFHPDGYKGESAWLIEMFTGGGELGVPLLQWMGMTAERGNADGLGMRPFPAMTKWLRD